MIDAGKKIQAGTGIELRGQSLTLAPVDDLLDCGCGVGVFTIEDIVCHSESIETRNITRRSDRCCRAVARHNGKER